TQHLNALLTPASRGFDPESTQARHTRTRTGPQPDGRACSQFKTRVLFPAWQTRADVLAYCAGVATSPDPHDPDQILRPGEESAGFDAGTDEVEHRRKSVYLGSALAGSHLHSSSEQYVQHSGYLQVRAMAKKIIY